MKKIIFELTWDDIHSALQNYVKDKAIATFEGNDQSIIETFISFEDKQGDPLKVETASVSVKLLM